jgi:hypothetical protein
MASKLMASPLISLAINSGSPEMKDKDVEKAKHARLDKNNMVKDAPSIRRDAPMTAANVPTWKPPTHEERMKNTGLDGMVNSSRDWVEGRISTKQHKENLKRAKVAANYKA